MLRNNILCGVFFKPRFLSSVIRKRSSVSYNEFEKSLLDTLEHTIGIRDGLVSLPCKDKVPENILHIPPLKDIHILLTSFGRDGVSNRILKDNPKLHFGAAVSGGSDSMFLIQYLHLFLSKRHSHLMDHLNYIPSLTAFVVDHKIRSESTKEANTVKKILNESGINCNILSLHWSHDDEHTKSKQAILRNKRYNILLEESRKLGIHYLFTGHNWNDQMETFLMRMSKGSSIQGLIGMNYSVSFTYDIELLRPLLHFPKEKIVETCKENNWLWVEDPSNQDTKYTRNYVRKLITSNSNELLNQKELQTIYENSLLLKNDLDNQITELLHNSFCFMWKYGAFILNLKELDRCDNSVVKLYTIRKALRYICRNPQKLSIKLCEELLEYLHSPSPKIFSIGGCLVYPCSKQYSKQYGISFIVVHSTEDVDAIPIVPDKVTIFDNRWLITCSNKIIQDNTSKYTVEYLKPNSSYFKKKKNLYNQLKTIIGHPPIVNSLIAILKDGKVIELPQFIKTEERKFYIKFMTS